MGLRFSRRVKLLPGVRLNFGKTGVSTSIGRRGAWLTFGGRGGTRATVGLPGTGLSYTTQLGKKAPGPQTYSSSRKALVSSSMGANNRAIYWLLLVAAGFVSYWLHT